MSMERHDHLSRGPKDDCAESESVRVLGKEATLRVTTSNEGAAIEIEDDGPGISDAARETMLQLFVSSDDARNMGEAAGFWLGLSIANAIVLAHGGVPSLHDRKPHGLNVRIHLPCEEQSRRSAA
jgi:signal transduction histidine kinase